MRSHLRPIILLTKASFKIQAQSLPVFLLSFLTPMMYTIILMAQIVINYQAVKNPFVDLPFAHYLLTFFVLQMTVFITYDQSQRHVAKEVLSGSFDYTLLRPISLNYFKYFRSPNLHALFMIAIYLTAATVTALVTHMPVTLYLSMILFAFCAGFISLNIKSGMRGLVFYFRDILSSTRVEESMNIFVLNKPPEIFPLFLQTIFTLLLPFFVVHNNAFNLIRQYNTTGVWSLIGMWIIISLFFNEYIWRQGVKKYESG